MSKNEVKKTLGYANEHLKKVQNAWDYPTDWSDLSIYGLYCLEAAVKAAAIHFRVAIPANHYEKAKIAKQLAQNHGLPDISSLLIVLNSARKARAYGDVEFPEKLNAEDIATQIEDYVIAVTELIERVSPC
ncbi:MAG: hypothetical protein HW390_1747 [Candidatus Brocadiaceae bacterium]|nr:hypothetical protein [Candidatus Brocadiaceae bacterium]